MEGEAPLTLLQNSPPSLVRLAHGRPALEVGINSLQLSSP